MYSSTNNGVIWVKTIDGMREVRAIVEGTAGRLFAAIDSSIYVSTNNGANWNHLHSFYYYLVSLCCTQSGAILAGGWYGTIYCSTNSGSTWTTTTMSGFHSKIVANSSYVFLNSSNKIYRSSNNGISWENIYSVPPSAPIIYDLAIDNHGYVMMSYQYGVYRSMNNGANWSGLGAFTDIQSLYSTLEGTIYAGSIAGKIYKTTNEGVLWTEVYSNPGGFDVYSICSRSNGYVFAGIRNTGLVVSSNNGSTWNRFTDGITNQRVHKVEHDNSGNIYAGTEGDGLYKSTDMDLIGSKFTLHTRIPNNSRFSQETKSMLEQTAWCLRVLIRETIGLHF